MERSEMIDYSDNIAIMKIEEDLRKNPGKKPKLRCDRCGREVDSDDIREHGLWKVCKKCWIQLNWMRRRRVE